MWIVRSSVNWFLKQMSCFFEKRIKIHFLVSVNLSAVGRSQGAQKGARCVREKVQAVGTIQDQGHRLHAPRRAIFSKFGTELFV